MRDLQDIRELINPEGITDGKIVAAQARFYDYCKMMNPKFYRDDRPYPVSYTHLTLPTT